MADKKPKAELTREFFQRKGRKGGKNRAKNHSAEQLSRWARRGGRPKTKVA